jgi:extradiol dioxygenase family protein
MQINRIQHINIRCSASDLPVMEKFYSEVVGLNRGNRPKLRNDGIWMYLGDQPVVHISVRCEPGYIQTDHRGSIDHVAFDCRHAKELQERLQHMNIPFETSNVAGAGYQMFIRDPLGTVLEFNFPNDEAPSTN